MTDDRLQQIREREAKATPGPWRMQTCACGLGCDDRSAVKVGGELLIDCGDDNDCGFVVCARKDIPDLLAYVDELRTESESLRRSVAGLVSGGISEG